MGKRTTSKPILERISPSAGYALVLALLIPLIKNLPVFLKFLLNPAEVGQTFAEVDIPLSISISFGSPPNLFWLTLGLVILQVMIKRKRAFKDLQKFVNFPTMFVYIVFLDVLTHGYITMPNEFYEGNYVSPYVISSVILILLLPALIKILGLRRLKGEKHLAYFSDLILFHLPFWYLIKGMYVATGVIKLLFT